ncbi:hypothetical protein BSL78_09439 [Apostichopus japonicus]|uniref:NLR family CARD domain-containing protein 4 n=1 Tax=Stichopus japonicus TaxID=307972 RepID=A0A2G8L067_STIJA|nr:hypothetical protein BSL78_09439 [Apostichopus japonicus]
MSIKSTEFSAKPSERRFGSNSKFTKQTYHNRNSCTSRGIKNIKVFDHSLSQTCRFIVMAFRFVVAVLAAVVFHRGSTEIPIAVPECSLIQYLDIGKSGLIQCSFNESFDVVTWYNVNERRPILLYHDGVKSGEGYTSGEFDIHANGSLVIETVAVEHEAVYTVTRAMSSAVSAVSYDISVYTTVTPATTIPVIDQCSYKFGNVCMKSTLNQIEVTCAIRGSRPAIYLSWNRRTHERDFILPSNYMNFTNNNITYTSRVTTKFSFEESTFLTLLVCQAFSVPLNLMKEENIILIERQIDYNSILTPDKKNVKIHSRMALSCNDRVLNLITWKRYNDRQTDAETMFVSIFQSSNPIQMTYKDYKLEVDGSLSLKNTLVEHEGLYACTHDNGVGGGIKLHNVSVIVDPMPAFPVVDGCNHQQYCVLEKEPRDALTCSVLGIRPEVSLEWRAFRQETPIVFTQHELKVTQKGDVYDVSLTVNYDITVTDQNKHTVECRAVGKNSELFSLSTKVDLLFNNVLLRERDSNISTIAIIVGALLTNIVIIAVVLVFTCRKRIARRRPIEMLNNDIAETIPMVKSDKGYSEKDERFIKQLKAKYEILYDSVQPIPYIKDMMYCVDKVFVEGGIDIMTGISERKLLWDKLGSYQEVVKGNCLKTKRQIIEGEPGYGKSTLTLQLLYDWCKSIPTSPLKEVDVIIYLRLRQLGGVYSIFSAIRRFILPRDSDISEEDIKEILSHMTSVLVLLDGFDEYPDQESTETDIYHILKKNMFQGFNVILTTRPSCVPNDFAPHSDRVRLTGFGEEARRKYVQKAVVGTNGAVDRIIRKLEENPVLGDLCQVPLFFVLFAHMTYEDEYYLTFNSVTSFFRYMICCFHSHMKNKMKDENVRKFELLEHEHQVLDKVAFQALSGNNPKLVWNREQLRNQLGHEFYDQYLRIGIFVEEEVLNIADTTNAPKHIQYETEVHFYHKTVCEWYAAHYVAEELSGRNTVCIGKILKNLDHLDLQYLYRFACGLNKIAGEKIIQYLQQKKGSKKFSILCRLEQEDNTVRFLKSVSDLVSSEETYIREDDSELLQRSTIQILDVASKNQIQITNLYLISTFSGFDGKDIRLQSGLSLSSLSSVEKISINQNGKGNPLSEEEVIGLIKYGIKSPIFKELWLHNCKLPSSIQPNTIPEEARLRNIKGPVYICNITHSNNSF